METTTRVLTWRDVCEDPHLRDVPYKIELNEWGQIVMTPTRLRHGQLQYKIAHYLQTLTTQPGEIITECAIRTSKGTRVADVGWFSAERWARVRDAYDSPIAPEICVEVLSPTNAPGEIKQKRALYFKAGAREVWTCDLKGIMTFFGPHGPLKLSPLVPGFPNAIEG
jgi:Uma2 family endonuclease